MRLIEPLVVHDYEPPKCVTCSGDTEALHVLDEDEHTSIPLTCAGYCLGCDTLVVRLETNADGIGSPRARSLPERVDVA